MSKKVYITRRIPKPGLDKLSTEFTINHYDSDEAIPHDVLVNNIKGKGYDALLCMLTDKIDTEVLDAAGKNQIIVTI